ncbi:lipopolysaccharide biosynthesis protein [Vibrio metoecus]|uniref:lipopolysaccharide biosynthesis protein n=1 Tax=Vibrio metoecus TaxID=1481663 RepID=UPI0013021668|nr:oligosaccharide flippase family protein [Vibrio metoecus]
MKKVISYGLNEFLCKGLNLGLVLLLPIILTQEEFGKVVYYISIEQIMFAIIIFGQQNKFIKDYQRAECYNEKNIVYNKSKKVSLILFAIVLLCILFSAVFTDMKPVDFFILITLATGCFLYALYEIDNIRMRSDENHNAYFNSKITYQLIKFFFCLVLIKLLDFESHSYVMAIFVSVAFVNIINAIKLKSGSFIGQKVSGLDMMMIWPFALQAILNIGYSFVDRLMIKKMMTDNDLALYGFAYNLASLVFFAISVIFLVYLPKFYSERDINVARKILKTSCFYSLIMVIIFFTLLFFLYDYLMFFFPAEYSGSYQLTLMLTFNYGVHIIYLYFFHMNNFNNSIGLLPYVVAISFGLSITACYILIPTIGILGAAISTISTQVTLSVLMWLISNRDFKHAD